MLGERADEVPATEVGSHSWFARVMVDGLNEYFDEVSARGVDVSSEPADAAVSIWNQSIELAQFGTSKEEAAERRVELRPIRAKFVGEAREDIDLSPGNRAS